MNNETVTVSGDSVTITTQTERVISKAAYIAAIQKEIDQLTYQNGVADTQKATRSARIADLQARLANLNTQE